MTIIALLSIKIRGFFFFDLVFSKRLEIKNKKELFELDKSNGRNRPIKTSTFLGRPNYQGMSVSQHRTRKVEVLIG